MCAIPEFPVINKQGKMAEPEDMEDDLLALINPEIVDDSSDSSDPENNVNEPDEEEEMQVQPEKAVAKPSESGHGDGSKKEKNKKKAPQVTFDKSLPGAHSYLGSDLEDVRGRTVHEDDSYQTLPLLSLPGVVLTPGQTLPLNLFQPTTVAMIRNIVQEDKTFGLVCSRFLGESFSATLANIGTTAEILAIKEEVDDAAGITTVRVKAIGRQRFEVKETRRQIDGIVVAKVRILPEHVLSDPLIGAHPPSHRRLFAYDHLRSSPKSDEPGHDMAAMLAEYLRKKKKVNRLSSALHTWWPPWVYKQYDLYDVMRRVRAEMKSWNESLRDEMMPQDPVDFSYWLAGNLPLDDAMKIQLLRIDSAIQRLRCELNIMQRCTVLCCKECGVLITHKEEVFSMMSEGLLAAYVNPGGYVHETLTVHKAQGLDLIGRSSTENTWFPGYAWTIAQCHSCHTHMGWKFKAVKKKLKPEKFWGLCRSSLLPGLQKDEENSESWVPIM